MPWWSARQSRLRICCPCSARIFVLADLLWWSIPPLCNAQTVSTAHKQVTDFVDGKADNQTGLQADLGLCELGYRERSSAHPPSTTQRRGLLREVRRGRRAHCLCRQLWRGQAGRSAFWASSTRCPVCRKRRSRSMSPSFLAHRVMDAGTTFCASSAAALAAVAVKEYMEANRVRPGHCAITARPPRKAARARFLWCATVCSKMST